MEKVINYKISIQIKKNVLHLKALQWSCNLRQEPYLTKIESLIINGLHVNEQKTQNLKVFL